jgi:hypothetical protein
MTFLKESQPSRSAVTTAGLGGVATWLTGLACALALVASLLGLLLDGVYRGPASTTEMLRAYDLVTAAVAVPCLAFAVRLARPGSIRAQLVATGLLGYLVYTYAFYAFGSDFNDLFLLQIAVFATAVYALILLLVDLDATAVARRFARTRARGIAAPLAVLAVSLGAMWISAGVDNAVTGAVPTGSRLVETESVIRLGMALDLILQVPLYAVAAVLIWRRAPWGYVLAGLALVAGVVQQVSYLVAMPFQRVADVPGAVWSDSLEPVIVLLYVLGAVLLLLGGRDRNPTEGS